MHTTHKARTPVDKHQGAMETAHGTHKARTPVYERQGATDTTHTTHQARTRVNECQGAMDTAHTTHKKHTPLNNTAPAVNERHKATDTPRTRAPRGAGVQSTKSHTLRVGHSGATQLTRRASGRGRTPRPLVQAPDGLHRGPWQTSRGVIETTGDRRTGTQPKRGSSAKQRDPATRATGVRRSYRRQPEQYPLW